MSDHLPECGFSPGQPGWVTINAGWVTINDGVPQPYVKPSPCICDRLRACEQRVRLEDDDYAYVTAQAEAEGRRHGWREALDAAREEVARLQHKPGANIANAVSAIDALFENPDDQRL